VLGLVCATFFGGAVRTLLRSDRLHDRIVTELKDRFPKHEFQIGRTEVLLSRGLWPSFGLRLHGLVFKQDVCGKLSFVLNLPEAVLPLDVLGLRKGRLRLRDVEIDGGELRLDYHACPPPAEPSVGPAAADRPGSAATITPPKLEWDELARLLNGFEIKNFAITYEKNPTWKLHVKTAYIALSDEMSAQAAVEVQKSLPFGALTHPVDLELRADRNTVQWSFTAGLKEGSARFLGSVDAATQMARATVDLRQMPIRDFMSEMFQMGFMEHDLKLKGAWLSCDLRWEGSLQNYSATPVQVRDCRVEGGYGRAELNQAEFWLNTDEYFREPARVRLLQLQMQPVTEALNRKLLPAVISHLGLWSGQVEVQNRSTWNFDGQLENAEIIFANQSLRGKQVVEKLHTRAVSKNGAIRVHIDDVTLREGQFKGFMEGELVGDGRSGAFQVQVDALSLAPSIQRLLIGGNLAPLTVHGKGVLSEGELNEWSGVSTCVDVQGEGWRARAIQLHSVYRAGTVTIDGDAKSVVVNGSWSLYPQLRPVLNELPADVVWRSIGARVEIQKTGGTLQALTASQEGGAVWKSKGSWVRDGEFNGTLTVNHGRRAQNFSLRGERGQLTVRSRP
jgi:hypothetical protein